MVRGAGTALNVATVLVGSGLGVLLGHRLSARTRDVVTDGLGLLVVALSAASVLGPALAREVGDGAPCSSFSVRRTHRGWDLTGDVLPDPHIGALTAAGGLLLVGVGSSVAQDQAAAGRRSAAGARRCAAPGRGCDDDSLIVVFVRIGNARVTD